MCQAWGGRRRGHNISYLVTTFQISPLREVFGPPFRVPRSPEQVLCGWLKFPEDTKQKVGRGCPRMRRGLKRVMTRAFAVRVYREKSVRVRAANQVAKLTRKGQGKRLHNVGVAVPDRFTVSYPDRESVRA